MRKILSSMIFLTIWIQAHTKAVATPCSCWDSGTSVYMGAKCHAAWDDMEDFLGNCLNDKDQTCRNVLALFLGIPLAILGMHAMETCHKLCNAAQKSGASHYTGNEWWYADQTAFNACLKQNPKVLRNWKG